MFLLRPTPSSRALTSHSSSRAFSVADPSVHAATPVGCLCKCLCYLMALTMTPRHSRLAEHVVQQERLVAQMSSLHTLGVLISSLSSMILYYITIVFFVRA